MKTKTKANNFSLEAKSELLCDTVFCAKTQRSYEMLLVYFQLMYMRCILFCFYLFVSFLCSCYEKDLMYL